MNNRTIALIIISIIVVCIIIISTWYMPLASQKMMLSYDNEWKEGMIGFKTYIMCPIDNSSENVSVIGMVEQYEKDPRVDGQRIDIALICKCEKHNIVWSQS